MCVRDMCVMCEKLSVHEETPEKKNSTQRVTKAEKRGQRREEEGGKEETKSPQTPKCRVAPTRFGDICRVQVCLVGWLAGWLCGEPCTTRGRLIRVCARARTDQTFCLIFLPRRTGRRLYLPKSTRDQSDAYLMLTDFQQQDCGLRARAMHSFPRPTP